jgi:hypothetical protein
VKKPHPTESEAYWRELAARSRAFAMQARRTRRMGVESIEIYEREAAGYERQADLIAQRQREPQSLTAVAGGEN